MIIALVIFLSAISIVSALIVAMGPNRGLIGIGSITLTGCLGLLAWFIFEMNAVFWLFPTFLIVDLSLVYLLASSELVHNSEENEETESREVTIYNIFWIAILTFLTLLIMNFIWNMPLDNLSFVNNAFAETYQSLWTGNWYLALFCLMVLCPAAFGALLMMRSKK